ncbi:hypothetical protein evm_006954 [Chilo suppressalis]|nr:hypothetical protein evm_006954 [Chilo suppressalis]
MFLAVELKNVCGEKEQEFNIEVLEASLFSRQWRFTGFTTVANRVDMLASHERLHLIFKAQRILENLTEGKVEHTCLKLNEESKVNLTQYYKYISDFKPSFLENMDLPTENPTKRQALIQSMFVIRWRARNKTVGRTTIGQHCLWLDCFTKAASRKKEPIPTDMPALQLDDSDNKSDLMDPKQKNRKDNVVFQLEHTNMIQHNFKQRRLCLVPITINLVNCYEVPVKVFIDMSKQQNRESIGELGWAGALSNGPEVEDKKLGATCNLLIVLDHCGFVSIWITASRRSVQMSLYGLFRTSQLLELPPIMALAAQHNMQAKRASDPEQTHYYRRAAATTVSGAEISLRGFFIIQGQRPLFHPPSLSSGASSEPAMSDFCIRRVPTFLQFLNL